MSEPDEFDWPYADYLPPIFVLREQFNYLPDSRDRPDSFDARVKVFDRMDAFVAALAEAHDVIESAIELSHLDAAAAWSNHEVWLPTLDFSLSSADEPARLLLESMQRVGIAGSDGATSRDVCAAVALWCYGEYRCYGTTKMLEQAALALAEAEYERRAIDERTKVSKRNRESANKRHARNGERKLRGYSIWKSREWKVQADAEREISKQCNIEVRVAGNWIREYKRSPAAYSAMQSEHSASEDE